MEAVKDNLLHVTRDLLSLAENGMALGVHGLVSNLGVEHHVGEDVKGLVDIGLLYLAVVDSGLTRGVGVEGSAEVLDLGLELVARALVGALEHHVLEEVSNTVVLLSLETATGIDEDTDGGSITIHSLGGNTDTVLQSRNTGLRVP